MGVTVQNRTGLCRTKSLKTISLTSAHSSSLIKAQECCKSVCFTACGATSLFPYAAAAAAAAAWTLWHCWTQHILSLLQVYLCMCPAEAVLHSSHYAEWLIQLVARVQQAFLSLWAAACYLWCRICFRLQLWDPSASDLPRISRAGDWLTGAFLMAMWNSVRGSCSVRRCVCVRACVRVCVHRKHNVTLTTIYGGHWGRTASVRRWTEEERGSRRYLRVFRSVCENMPNVWVCVRVRERGRLRRV